MGDDTIVSLDAWRGETRGGRSGGRRAPESHPATEATGSGHVAGRPTGEEPAADAAGAASVRFVTVESTEPAERLATVTPLGGAAEPVSDSAADALAARLGTSADLLRARAELDRLTSRRDHTMAELRRALEAHELSESAIDQVLQEGVDRGDIDDARLAEQLVRAQLRRRGQGATMIRRTLEERGFERETIEAALSAVGADAQIAEAERLAAKRLRAVAMQPIPVQRHRIGDTLRRRGFDAEVIEAALRAVLG